jgi:lipoate-protein ligase A
MNFNRQDWFLLESGADGAARNMAMDAALLELGLELPGPVLRFYAWTEAAATFGYFQKIVEVERATGLRPLVRRPTGGGIVPHDADWTYSVTIPTGHEWHALSATESYRRMHDWICAAFGETGVETELAAACRKTLPGQCFAGHEKFDVLWRGRKVAGAAQRRTKAGLLIQGSVQPPPVARSRVDWERAMLSCIPGGRPTRWEKLALDERLKARRDELAAAVFAQDSHNRRR